MRLSLLENSWTLTGVYPLAERHFPGIVFISILAEKKFANNTDKNSKTTCTQIYNLYIKYIYMQPWANTTNQFLFDQTLHWAGQWTNWKRQNGQYGQHGSLLFQFWPTAPLPTYLPFKSSDLVYAFFIPANKLGSLLGFVWAPWLWVCFFCFWPVALALTLIASEPYARLDCSQDGHYSLALATSTGSDPGRTGPGWARPLKPKGIRWFKDKSGGGGEGFSSKLYG